MICPVTVILPFVFFAQTHGSELEDPVNNLVNMLADNLMDRAFKEWSFNQADMDSTMIAKPGSAAALRSPSLGKAPVPRSGIMQPASWNYRAPIIHRPSRPVWIPGAEAATQPTAKPKEQAAVIDLGGPKTSTIEDWKEKELEVLRKQLEHPDFKDNPEAVKFIEAALARKDDPWDLRMTLKPSDLRKIEKLKDLKSRMESKDYRSGPGVYLNVAQMGRGKGKRIWGKKGARTVVREDLKMADQMEEKKKLEDAKVANEAKAESLRGKTFLASLAFKMKGGKLSVQVTKRDIVNAIYTQADITVDEKEIEMPTPIKKEGEYDVTLNLKGGVKADIKVKAVEDASMKDK